MDSMQPGQVIIPHSADEPQPSPVPSPVPSPLPSPGAPVPERPEQEPGESPHPAPSPTPGPTPAPDGSQAQTPQSGFAYVGSVQQPVPVYAPYVGADAPDVNSRDDLPESITWEGSEYIEHQKGAKWYGFLVVGGLIAAVLNYVITKDVFSSGAIMIAAIALGVFASHKPRTQQYALSREGLQIGNKVYYFEDFKNFSIATEGAIAGLVFMPLKRFMPPLTIYVSPDMEDQVVGFLSEILPFEQHRADVVDSLLRKIRF